MSLVELWRKENEPGMVSKKIELGDGGVSPDCPEFKSVQISNFIMLTEKGLILKTDETQLANLSTKLQSERKLGSGNHETGRSIMATALRSVRNDFCRVFRTVM